MAESNTVNSIKPVYKIANILALVPPFNADKQNVLFKYKCYSIFISLLTMFGFMYSAYLSILFFPEQKRFQIYCVIYNMFMYIVTTASGISAVVLSAFQNIRLFKLFHLEFDTIDKHGWSKPKPTQICNRMIIELLFVHIALIICAANSARAIIPEYGVKVYLIRFALDLILQYFRTILVLLMYNYSKLLKIRFKQLNKQIEDLVRKYLKKNLLSKIFLTEINATNNPIFLKFHHLKTVYYKLTDLIELYDELFGWPMLLFYLFIIVTVLDFLNALILDISTIPNFAVLLIWASINLVMGVVVAVTCDMTTKEAQRTATVCYNLLLEVPAGSNNVQDRILREELILLAQQATHQCPRFSAAGFFTVDYTMLFGLLGTVTSYIIVLIQINK